MTITEAVIEIDRLKNNQEVLRKENKILNKKLDIVVHTMDALFSKPTFQNILGPLTIKLRRMVGLKGKNEDT